MIIENVHFNLQKTLLKCKEKRGRERKRGREKERQIDREKDPEKEGALETTKERPGEKVKLRDPEIIRGIKLIPLCMKNLLFNKIPVVSLCKYYKSAKKKTIL